MNEASESTNPSQREPVGKIRSEKPKPKNKMSRRRFLKVAAMGTVALATEPMEKWLRDTGILQEANALQVSREFTEMLAKYFSDPSPKNQRLAEAWLKFNGAIHFTARADAPVASRMATHFLYGDGKTIDISKELTESTRSSKDTNQSMRNFAQKCYSSMSSLISEKTDGPYLRTIDEGTSKYHTIDSIPEMIKNQKQARLFGITRGTNVNEDLALGLGDFTISIGGVPSQYNPQTREISFSPGSVLKVTDRYDWSKDSLLFAKQNLYTMFEQMGIADKIPKQWAEKAKQTDLQITDSDGVLLVENGFAHEFNVESEFTFHEGISVPIPNELPIPTTQG